MATFGPKVMKLGRAVGVEAHPWQGYCLDGMLAVDDEGFWAETVSATLVARQNGKGEILLPYELAHLLMFPRPDGKPKTIVHTAHEFKTAREAFRRMKLLFERNPSLYKRLKNGHRSIRTSHGEESFEMANGNRLLFLARSANSGVGFTIDILIFDEAQELSFEARDALAFTTSAVPNRQIIYTGSVPKDAQNPEVWEDLRNRGRSGKATRLGWREWTPEGSEDPDLALKIDPQDDRVRSAANPGRGIQVTDKTIDEEFEDTRSSPESFNRERLSIWPQPRPAEEVRFSDLDMAQYRKNADPEAALGEAPVVSVAIGRGGQFATVSAASRYDDDEFVFKHLRTSRQTLWLPKYLVELKRTMSTALLVLDPKNAQVILTELETQGLKFLPMSMAEIAGAHAFFIERSNAGIIRHPGQEEVEKSFQYATTRKIGAAGFTWEASDIRKPISHAQSVTWAVWGVTKNESNPNKRSGKVW